MSNIQIQVKCGNSAENSYVQYAGEQQHIITDSDRSVFGLSATGLKNAVEAYFGKKPNDAFLRSPTPWGDLYQSYGWDQVQTHLIPRSAKVLGVELQPTIISKKTLKNSSSVPGTFSTSISDSVSNTVTDEWSVTHGLSFEQSIKYQIGFLGIGGGGETTFGYTASWGKSTTQSTSITVGTESGVSVYLEPGQAVEVVLIAQRGTMKVEVEYSMYLGGANANNYNPAYNGHHFWAFDIRGVMNSGNLSNDLRTTESMNIGYYCDDIVEIRNPTTKAVICVVPRKFGN